MKSLQNQYNLIKEGKGNKELFLKEAKAQFPQYISNVQTFDQVIHSLTEKGILSETLMLGGVAQPKNQDWFKIFNENVKAELKDTDKEVEEMETRGYNYKEKNNNNISTAEMLKGYYVEMRDPKHAEKTEDQIKAIVVKNLEKDPLFYVKDGEFGVKGLGYKSEHPGLPKDIYGNYALGIEPKVKLTGKYKSSGMEPVKLNESKHSDEADLKIYKSELNMLNKTKPTGEKQLKRKAELEKKIADLEKKVTEVFYGSSDGDYEADQKNEQIAYHNYDKGLKAYREGDFLKADEYYKTALKYGSYLGYTEQDLPPYEKATGSSLEEGEEEYRRKMLPNKVKGIADTIDIKSTLERLAPEVWGEPSFEKAKQKFLTFIEGSRMNPATKKQMLFNLSTINTKGRLDQYLANSLLNFEKLGVKEGMISEGSGMSLRDAMKQAKEESRNGYVQHIEDSGDGTFSIADWYDSDKTIASYENGVLINDKTDEYELDELDMTGIAGSEDEEEVRQGMKGINTPKHETLSEAKKRDIEKHIKEIEKMGEVAAWDHRITKAQEKIDELMNEMTMTESDQVAKYVDKEAVKGLKKDIALLEKKKALYEKQKARAAKRMKDKSMMEDTVLEDSPVLEVDATSMPTTAMMLRMADSNPEKFKEYVKQMDADPAFKTQFMKKLSPTEKEELTKKIEAHSKTKTESWSGMVRELITRKNLRLR
jgi:hypothetical protein